ncbi:MAG: hypothetical protein ACOH2D_14755 [Gelidibacter sp.]
MNPFKTIKFLNVDDFRHLRVVRCRGKEYNGYSLFLFYLRDFEYENIDELDQGILESLNQTQEAVLELNQKILLEGQLEEVMSRYELEEKIDITIQLSPIVTNELIREVELGREIFSYLKYFKANFRKGYDFMHLSNYFLGYLDVERLNLLQNTMKAI